MKNKLLNKEAEELINYIEEGQKRIDSAKTKLVSITDDFNIWAKYSIQKTHYPYILPRNSLLMDLLEKYYEDIFERRYSTIDLEWVLEFLNDLFKEGHINKDDIEEIKKYLQKINFGSMRIDW